METCFLKYSTNNEIQIPAPLEVTSFASCPCVYGITQLRDALQAYLRIMQLDIRQQWPTQ